MNNTDGIYYLETLIVHGFIVDILPENGGIACIFDIYFNEDKYGYNILEMLLRAGANPNTFNYNDKYDNTLITKYLTEYFIGYDNEIDLLLNYGANIGDNNNLLLLRTKYPAIYEKYFGDVKI